jgi:hypothetical protein
MEEVTYKLFPAFVQRKTWRSIYAFIDQSVQVTDELKEDWRRAIDFMRAELGNGFFTTARIDHPLSHLMGSASKAEVEYLVRWVNTLIHLKTNPMSYAVLMDKLRSSTKCRPEGMPFMEIALSFSMPDLHVSFIPESKEAGIKTPDVMVKNTVTGENLFVEVSRVNDAAERAKQTDQYHAILKVIDRNGFDLPMAGALKKYLNEEEFDETVRDIKYLKEACWRDQSMVSIINHRIAIAFSTNGSFSQLEEWCIQTGYSRGFSGLSVNFNDIHRIVDRGRIADKALQIPKTETGLLYFPVQALFLLFSDPFELIESLQFPLSKQPHIFGVVLFAEMKGSLKKDVYMDCRDFIYSVSTDERHYTRETIFVENIAYAGNLSSEMQYAIRKSIA